MCHHAGSTLAFLALRPWQGLGLEIGKLPMHVAAVAASWMLPCTGGALPLPLSY